MHFFIYCVFRFVGLIISLLSYKQLHRVGNALGLIIYYVYRPFRKKALANLAIAFGKTKNEKERQRIAKLSFQNLMITCLEFFRFKKSQKNIGEIATLLDNFSVKDLLDNKHGIVFLTAHQANWEIPFMALTARYPGIAIGRPIKNQRLYSHILSVREMYGGKIVTPKNAIRAGLKTLKEGQFLGIVGDQAYPESPYSYPLLGTRAWTTSSPALLAYRTGCPIVVGMTKRIQGHYYIESSAPIWPNLHASIKEEVPRMMDEAMRILEKSILQIPEQWMWVHDRWKQQGIDHVKRKYRSGFVLVVLPTDASPFKELLPLFRKIYPRSFITCLVPKGAKFAHHDLEIQEYETENDLFIRDWRFQIVLDFYGSWKLRRHFLRLGAVKALGLKKMTQHEHLKEQIAKQLVKSECLTTDFI